jgi:diphthamide synthase (EF-2-diphthine--ammonia ligase)
LNFDEVVADDSAAMVQASGLADFRKHVALKTNWGPVADSLCGDIREADVGKVGEMGDFLSMVQDTPHFRYYRDAAVLEPVLELFVSSDPVK